MTEADISYLARALELARENVANGGGPFGALVVRDGQVIAESANEVIAIPDPTAHAEVQAIRKAAEALDSYDLSGTTLYTSCEPCPMCLGAIYWARISRVVFASDRFEAEKAGFRDAGLYRELAMPPDQRSLPFEHLKIPMSGREFEDWMNSGIRKDY